MIELGYYGEIILIGLFFLIPIILYRIMNAEIKKVKKNE